jgi:hypothetical protein
MHVCDRLAAEIERPVPNLGLSLQAVGLALAGPDQMRHRMAASDKQLRDEAAVATKPGSLGAHETWGRLTERIGQCSLPLGCSHTRRVAAEGAQAREALLARLAAAPASELDGVAVRDPRRVQSVRQGRLIELWVPPRARPAPNVDERLDRSLAQAGDELVELSSSVPDGEDAERHLNRIAASAGMELKRWPRA